MMTPVPSTRVVFEAEAAVSEAERPAAQLPATPWRIARVATVKRREMSMADDGIRPLDPSDKPRALAVGSA